MTGLRSLGAAVGIFSFVAAAALPTSAHAGARVCTSDTHMQTMLSRTGQPASDRVMAVVEGNLPLFAVDLSLDDSLRGEVSAQQMEIMRSVARELGFAHDAPTPVAGD